MSYQLKFRLRFVSRAMIFTLAASSCLSLSTRAQQATQLAEVDPIPSAPEPVASPSPMAAQTEPSRFHPGKPLTLRSRFSLEVKTMFGPAAFLIPAGEAGETMIDPPDRYPHEWRDGAGAFGRNYGAEFVRHTTGGVTHFATAALLREDPRYYPSASTNLFSRAAHALAFTLVDRSDSGRRTIAFSNLAGSAAAGFIGMAYYPAGFDDTTHAYQRASVEVTSFAAHNLVAEFAPEFSHIAHKLHFPDRVADSMLPADRKQP